MKLLCTDNSGNCAPNNIRRHRVTEDFLFGGTRDLRVFFSLIALAMFASSAPAADWKLESQTQTWETNHCYPPPNDCFVTYSATTKNYSGYFAGSTTAKAACEQKLGEACTSFSTTANGPRGYQAGYKVTYGPLSFAGYPVWTLNELVTAYDVDVVIDRPEDNACRAGRSTFGNPIDPLMGTKTEKVATQSWSPHAPSFLLLYSSLGILAQQPNGVVDGSFIPGMPGGVTTGNLFEGDSNRHRDFGNAWTHDFQSSLKVGNGIYPKVSLKDGINNALFGGSPLTSRIGSSDTLQFLPNGTWRHLDADARRFNYFGANGALLERVNLDGSERLTFTYSDSATPLSVAPGPGRLLKVQDFAGRALTFNYGGSNGLANMLVDSIVNDNIEAVGFEYDNLERLTGLRFPDGTRQTFSYENPALPLALTGKLNEEGARTATFVWDDVSGVVLSTSGPGTIDRYSVTYATKPMWQVSDSVDGSTYRRRYSLIPPTGTSVISPSGGTLGLTGASLNDGLIGTSRTQPAGAGCNAASSNSAYDLRGNMISSDDFNGGRACYAYDATRNLQTVRVEGLANTVNCMTVVASGATLPTGARKTSTAWHPTLPLIERVASPGSIQSNYLNGRTLPNGNPASCMPFITRNSDSDQPAPVCVSRVEATTDVNGAQGFGATLQVGAQPREQKWTYNQHAQVLTHDGPRTDISDVTTYTYYTDTAANHIPGDIASATNAVGRVTQYTKHSRSGQLLEVVDPNGVVTTNIYDTRQRLLSTSVGGQVTTLEWYLNGTLKKIVSANGNSVNYEYDDAQRLIAAFDNIGNRIEYTLDNIGNRIGEQEKDPSGVLRRTLNRSVDALGRVQSVTGRE